MTVTTRTNLATNPSAATTATNYAAVAGTGGTATVAWNGGIGYLGVAGFPRVAWTVATTAVSGGLSYTQTGLAAATQYAHQIWVRCSKAQTVALSAQYQNASAVNVGAATSGASVALVANTWTQLTATATSGAAVDRVVLTAAAVAGGSNWASGDTFDGEAVLIEAPPVARTNLATNPSLGAGASTGWGSQWAGGGTMAATNAVVADTSLGGYGWKKTWTTGGTIAGDVGNNYTHPGITAGSVYSFSVAIKSNLALPVEVDVQWLDSTGATVGSRVFGTTTTLAANGAAVRIKLENQTAPAGATQVVVVFGPYQGGIAFAANDWLMTGQVMTEQASTAGTYFDGSTAASATTLYGWTGTANASTSVAMTTPGTYFAGGTANTTGLPTNLTYAWTGTANASTSTETTRTVSLTATGSTPSGSCPRAQVTISDAGPSTAYTVRLTRLCEGVTMPVQGAVTRKFTDADVINDFACPLNRTVTYNLIYNGSTVATATVTLSATTAWISDPLQPDKSIPIKLDGNNPGYLTMDLDSLQDVTYPNAAKTVPILGSPYPVLMGGQAQAATGLALCMYSDDKATADSFRTMITGTQVLLLRPLTNMDPLPAVAFMSRVVKESDVSRKFGGTTALWTVTGDLVAAVTQAVLSGLNTYADVQNLITTANTYGQVQTKSAAKTYLDWQKNPLIWSTL